MPHFPMCLARGLDRELQEDGKWHLVEWEAWGLGLSVDYDGKQYINTEVRVALDGRTLDMDD
jgi:hypothetical protein